MQPLRYPASHTVISRQRPVMLIPLGTWRRQLLFVPGLVLKLVVGRRLRRAAEREAVFAHQAAGHGFWSDLALPPRRVPLIGMAMRRHGSVRLEDYKALDRLLLERLERARHWPEWQPVADLVRANPHTGGHLPRRVPRLEDARLPVTSMHGDLHMFNFVRRGGGFGLLDWEFFNPGGSFVFDFMDFRFFNVLTNSGQNGYRFMAGLTPDNPTIAFVADRLRIDPWALIAYYGFTRVNTMISRRGGLDGLPADQRRGAERVLALCAEKAAT